MLDIIKGLEAEDWIKKEGEDTLFKRFYPETEDKKVGSIVEITLSNGKIKLGVLHSKKALDSKLSYKMITCELPLNRHEVKLISDYINLF